jgi:hypothetical protein
LEKDMATPTKDTRDSTRSQTTDPLAPHAATGPNVEGRPTSWKDRREQRLKDQEKQDKAIEQASIRRATQGVMDQETRDKVLALGGDVTRSSPVLEQALPDPEPGLTTTTGAHRTPIDPTTAAVPAGEYDPRTLRMRGAPTIGSGKSGRPEKLFKEPEVDPKDPPEQVKPVTPSESDEDEKDKDTDKSTSTSTPSTSTHTPRRY